MSFGLVLILALSFNLAQARVLRRGMTGEDVKDLQRALQAQGYYSCGTNCQVDGNFGVQTESAVKQLQTDQRIAVDGVVGSQTAAFLGLDIGATNTQTSCAFDGDGSCKADEACVNYFCVPKNTAGSGVTSGTSNSSGSGCPASNPLCVPESPYAKESLAGSGTIMDLVKKVLNALLFFAGIVAVVAMILGGYQYIAARGNEEMVEKGQKTLTNAVIGLVVVIMAYAIVNLLVKSLTSDPTKTNFRIYQNFKI